MVLGEFPLPFPPDPHSILPGKFLQACVPSQAITILPAGWWRNYYLLFPHLPTPTHLL